MPVFPQVLRQLRQRYPLTLKQNKGGVCGLCASLLAGFPEPSLRCVFCSLEVGIHRQALKMLTAHVIGAAGAAVMTDAAADAFVVQQAN